jgi:predicted GIY-YIG superfamily endonuclease
MIMDSHIIKPDGKLYSSSEIKELIDELVYISQNMDNAEVSEYNNEHDRRSKRRKVSLALCEEKRAKPGFIYIAQGTNDQYKIGLSNNPEKRMKEYTKLPFETKLVLLIRTHDMVWLEKVLHERFANQRIRGEWFLLKKCDLKWVRNSLLESIVYDIDRTL